MDAVPVTLGQEFGGYASQIEHGTARVRATLPDLRELAIGGTAVGTGMNAYPGYRRRAIQALWCSMRRLRSGSMRLSSRSSKSMNCS